MAAADHDDVEFAGELHQTGQFYGMVSRETMALPLTSWFHVKRGLMLQCNNA
jgi:hypothetical protein